MVTRKSFVISILVAVLALIVPMGAQKRTAPVRLFITSVGAANGFTDPNKGNQDTMKDLRDEVKGRKSLALAESRDDAAIVLVVMNRWYDLAAHPRAKRRLAPSIIVVSRRHLVIHFFAEPGLTPSENKTSCYWRVRDADRFYEEFAALKLPSEGIPRLTAPVDQPWGMREFTLVDPSGNLVLVGHDLGDAYIPQDS